ncbi:ceramide-1-phosphate transfer protein-like isoform X1 [Astyanax mexicanus]|uniref:Ceramide-1-phosphate transfer protein n=1 Tax=Astyanax mexicanus TaxID=7994 RepID=A0A8B9LQN0_ASTMX|nr:ceramide-1-phosphate transfer protein-like isoform X1 [Astyanax mexicanus]
MRMVRQYVFSAVMFTLFLFLTSLWLPQEMIQDCELSWIPCLNVFSETRKVDAAGHVVSNSRNNNNINDNNNSNNEAVIEVCPGQDFQVSRLLLHLNSSLGSASDVLLEPYLLCWEELIKFMEALGSLVGFFTGKVQEKIVLIRRLSEEESAKFDLLSTAHLQHHAYYSVRSMLEAELQRGMVNFDRRTDSGSRTLLRLHRSLLWLQLLLEKLRGGEDREEERSLGTLCAEAYAQALAPYHPWLLQQAAQLAFRAMPSRAALLPIVCVRTQEEAEPILHTIITAIREVHLRTQRELEQRNMLNLP